MRTLYIENEIKNHPQTLAILDRLPNPDIIEIERYGEVFNRRNQNFRLQKKSPALILAKKYDGWVLPAPGGYGIGGNKNYYFSHLPINSLDSLHLIEGI